MSLMDSDFSGDAKQDKIEAELRRNGLGHCFECDHWFPDDPMRYCFGDVAFPDDADVKFCRSDHPLCCEPCFASIHLIHQDSDAGDAARIAKESAQSEYD